MPRKQLHSLGLLILIAALITACGTNREATKAKLLQSGNEYFERQKFREAAIMYSRAIQQDRLFGEAYYRLALAQTRLGRFAEAARALHRAAELQPENDDVFIRLANIYLSAIVADRPNRGKYLLELKDLVTRADEVGTEPFEVLKVRGAMEFAEEDYEAAAGFFRQAYDLRHGDPSVARSLVRTLNAAGNLAEAEKIALAILDKDPAIGEMYDQLYVAYLARGDEEAAGKIIRRKVENNPEAIEYKLQLAAHYHRLGQPSERDEVLDQIASRPNKSMRQRTRFAELYERIGNYDAAVREYRKAGEAYPDAKSYYQLRAAETLALTGRGADALQLVDEVIAAEPENELAIALRATLRLYGGDPELLSGAILDLEAVISDMPKNPVLRYNLGLAYLSVQDLDKAMVQFQEAIAMLPDYAAPKYQLGRIYLARQQPAMAAQLADDILALNPNSIRGRLLRANASIRLQEYNQARANIDAVLQAEPANADARFLLAGLYVAERNYDAAERILRELYESSPQDGRGIRGLIGVYVAKGQTDRAQSLLDEELDKNPNARQLRLISAEVAMAGRDYQRAIGHYERLLEMDPNSGGLHVEAGRAYYYSKDMAQAEKHFRRASELQPNSVTPKLRLALLVSEVGRLEESRQILQEILQAQPNNPIALNNVAYMLSESPNMLDTALSLAQKAVSRAPGNAHIAETLAWIYYKKGLSDSSIDIYRDICSRYPDNAKWRYRYALALYQKGDNPQARVELQQALASRPTPSQTKEINDLLAKIGS